MVQLSDKIHYSCQLFSVLFFCLMALCTCLPPAERERISREADRPLTLDLHPENHSRGHQMSKGKDETASRRGEGTKVPTGHMRVNTKAHQNVRFPSTGHKVHERNKAGSAEMMMSDQPQRRPNTKGGANHRSPASEGIVFPDDQSLNQTAQLQRRFIPVLSRTPPECARGNTFCENVDHYPRDHLDSLLKNDAMMEFRGMFGNDVVSDVNLIHRIDALDEHPLCFSREQMVFPMTAKNKDDKWLFVVNHGEFKQGVRVEKCLDESAQCEFTSSFPLNYKTTCKQKYIYRKLVALAEDGNTKSDLFTIPSCCACIVKAQGSLSARLGLPLSNQSPAATRTGNSKHDPRTTHSNSTRTR